MKKITGLTHNIYLINDVILFKSNCCQIYLKNSKPEIRAGLITKKLKKPGPVRPGSRTLNEPLFS